MSVAKTFKNIEMTFEALVAGLIKTATTLSILKSKKLSWKAAGDVHLFHEC